VENSLQYIGDVAGHQPVVQFAAPSLRLSGARWIHPAMEVEEVAPPTHVLMLHVGGSVRVERYLEGRHVASRSRLGTVGLMSAMSRNRWIIAAPTEVLHLYVPIQLLPVHPSTGEAIEMQDCFAREDPWLVHLMMMVSNEVFGKSTNGTLLLLDELERDWRLGHLATIASLSPDHLIRAFKQSVGTMPHRYLMRVRLNRALSLLQTDREVLISDVAKRCGFISESHFSTSFKTAFGVRPSAVVRARKLPG
jgi:AraC-like DNA-binding protein